MRAAGRRTFRRTTARCSSSRDGSDRGDRRPRRGQRRPAAPARDRLDAGQQSASPHGSHERHGASIDWDVGGEDERRSAARGIGRAIGGVRDRSAETRRGRRSRPALEQPGAMGDWTFKDVAAHLTAWRRRTVVRLEAAARGEAEPPPRGRPTWWTARTTRSIPGSRADERPPGERAAGGCRCRLRGYHRRGPRAADRHRDRPEALPLACRSGARGRRLRRPSRRARARRPPLVGIT